MKLPELANKAPILVFSLKVKSLYKSTAKVVSSIERLFLHSK